MPKRISDEKIVEALMLAKANEAKFIAAATDLFRAQLSEQIGRVRGQALLAGSYLGHMKTAVEFDFRPGHQRVELSTTGEVTSAISASESVAVL